MYHTIQCKSTWVRGLGFDPLPWEKKMSSKENFDPIPKKNVVQITMILIKRQYAHLYLGNIALLIIGVSAILANWDQLAIFMVFDPGNLTIGVK